MLRDHFDWQFWKHKYSTKRHMKDAKSAHYAHLINEFTLDGACGFLYRSRLGEVIRMSNVNHHNILFVRRHNFDSWKEMTLQNYCILLIFWSMETYVNCDLLNCTVLSNLELYKNWYLKSTCVRKNFNPHRQTVYCPKSQTPSLP